VSDIFEQPDDAATPLTEAEKRDLKPAYISTRAELNAAEQENIALGQDWAMRRRRDILTESFVKSLHLHMFNDVWRWAGEFRTSERNIGIDHWEIRAALRVLLDDTNEWIKRKTYPPDEIAVRFHHRLVWIHPFPNGNGRLSRLAADLLAVQLGQERFTWGSGNLVTIADLRKRYVDALRAADGLVVEPLLEFARS
jgi:Fic-DOC domain mobile mystery protein B